MEFVYDWKRMNGFWLAVLFLHFDPHCFARDAVDGLNSFCTRSFTCAFLVLSSYFFDTRHHERVGGSSVAVRNPDETEMSTDVSV